MNTSTHECRMHEAVATFLQILRERRSRRFGLGMKMATGPMAYESRHSGIPLSEEEEALLAFAACGVTGYALGDLMYEQRQGGTIMSRLLGRTIPSGDAAQTVALIVMNRGATYYVKRPQDFAPDEIPELVKMAEGGEYVELYRRSRVKIRDGRVAPPLNPLINLNCNQWSLYDPSSTYFLPVNELTWIYINGLLELVNEGNNVFIIDERANFRPAGLQRFAKSRGGHLFDDPSQGRVITIQQLEEFVTEMVTLEQGMMLQNIALMVQALGLGGFPHWAAHAFGWFQALGFRMGEMRASRYLGMGRILSALARLFSRAPAVPYVLGLEHNGVALLNAMCPPYYPSMEAAVRTLVDAKVGPQGIFRGGAIHSVWLDPTTVVKASPAPSEANIQAAIAYCEYVFNRYGRFPAYAPSMRTVLGFQVNHLDVEFYDRHYRAESLSEAQRDHLKRWHNT